MFIKHCFSGFKTGSRECVWDLVANMFPNRFVGTCFCTFRMMYQNRGFCTLSLPETILSVCSHSQVHKKSALPPKDLLVYDLGVTYPCFISGFRKPVAMVEGHTKITHSSGTGKLEVKQIVSQEWHKLTKGMRIMQEKYGDLRLMVSIMRHLGPCGPHMGPSVA